jgi:hypothetical protein
VANFVAGFVEQAAGADAHIAVACPVPVHVNVSDRPPGIVAR